MRSSATPAGAGPRRTWQALSSSRTASAAVSGRSTDRAKSLDDGIAPLGEFARQEDDVGRGDLRPVDGRADLAEHPDVDLPHSGDFFVDARGDLVRHDRIDLSHV